METLLPHLAVDVSGPIDVEALFSEPPRPGGAGVGGGARSESSTSVEKSIGASSLSALHSERPSSQPSPTRGEGYVLEIGFGGGEHLAAQASAHPELRFIGVEPFMNGVASCLRHIEESGVTNVRLHHGDARDVLAQLPDASLDRVDILFPDPWPKKRHWKRRLIQPDFVAELARVLKDGGEVRFATDWANYAAWTLALLISDQGFEWIAERAEDWRNAWPGHVITRYEMKRLGDCAPIFLKFVRCNT